MLWVQVTVQSPHAAVGNCNHGDVRLVNGSISWEGRVEVCWNGTWGTVCGNAFNRATAGVVCRQAGFLADIGWFSFSSHCLLMNTSFDSPFFSYFFPIPFILSQFLPNCHFFSSSFYCFINNWIDSTCTPSFTVFTWFLSQLQHHFLMYVAIHCSIGTFQA